MLAEQLAPSDIERLIKAAGRLREEAGVSDLPDSQQEVLDRAREVMHAGHAGQAATSPRVTALAEKGSQEVFMLRFWDQDHEDVTPWLDQDPALAHRASFDRANRGNVDDPENIPVQPLANDREAGQRYDGPARSCGDRGCVGYAEKIRVSALTSDTSPAPAPR